MDVFKKSYKGLKEVIEVMEGVIGISGGCWWIPRSYKSYMAKRNNIYKDNFENTERES